MKSAFYGLVLSVVFSPLTYAKGISNSDIAKMFESATSSSSNSDSHQCLSNNNFDACVNKVNGYSDNANFEECLKEQTRSFCLDAHINRNLDKYFKKMYDIAITPPNKSKLIDYIILSDGEYLTIPQAQQIESLIKNDNSSQALFAKFIIYNDVYKGDSYNPTLSKTADKYLQLAASKTASGSKKYNDKIMDRYEVKFRSEDFDSYSNFIKTANTCRSQCANDEYYFSLLDLIKNHNQIKQFYDLLMQCNDCDKPRLLSHLASKPYFKKSFKVNEFLTSIEYDVLKGLGYNVSMSRHSSTAYFTLNYKVATKRNLFTNQDTIKPQKTLVSINANCDQSGKQYTKRESLGLFEGLMAGNVIAKNVTYQQYTCNLNRPEFVDLASNNNKFTNSDAMKWKYSMTVSQSPIYGTAIASTPTNPQPSSNTQSTAAKGQFSIEKTYTGGFRDFGLAESRKVWVIKCAHNGSTAKVTTSNDGRKWYRLDGMSITNYNSFEEAGKRICR